MKPTSTWILIANGNSARILEALGNGRGFHEHAVSGGRQAPAGSAITPPRQRAAKALEALFASQLGTMLSAYLRNNAFDRLILIAPTTMLEELRKMISPAVREKVIVEIERDLTDIPNNEISRYLDDVVAL